MILKVVINERILNKFIGVNWKACEEEINKFIRLKDSSKGQGLTVTM